MRFSEQWLREWVNPELDTAALAHQLTMAGLEVDAIEPAADKFTGVVVAQVVDVQPHPNADKLRVCQVDDGSGEHQQVVCGAPNVHVGMKAPFARPGAVLPGDFKIKRAKLRGVESFGMLCSATELGLGEDSSGLWALPSDAPVGADLREWLKLDDQIIELGITPNRGDALSIRGLAREIAALNGLNWQNPDCSPVAAVIDQQVGINLQANTDCPLYGLRVIRNVRKDATTPLWMTEKLRRCGLRSIHPVVDVTNYILLELGQPMHAFDLNRVKGDITVRMADEGEKLVSLDQRELTLDTDMLVIADQQGPVALAGIIGGAHSAVDNDTTDILLEAAHFTPSAIAGRARRLGLNTDSSYRFERGVDPSLPRLAMERATRLLLEIVGGQPGPVVWAQGELKPRKVIEMSASFITNKLGIDVTPEQAADLLNRLEIKVERDGDTLRVTPPLHRFDIEIREDLVEEVARMIGYEHIRSEAPRATLTAAAPPESALPRARLADLLVDRGYREVITYSFVAESLLAMLNPADKPIMLANPISQEMAAMRTTLWAGLLNTAVFNMHRQQNRLKLFEIGLRFYHNSEGELVQDEMLAGLITGSAMPAQWGVPSRATDFFDLKGDVEALLQLTGGTDRFRFEAAEHPALHPGQSARIILDNRTVGWIGALHPAHQSELDLAQPVFLFEIERNALAYRAIPSYRKVSKFPSIRRDLALIVPDSIKAQTLVDLIHSLKLPILQSVELFDVYRGKGVEAGFASIALSLIFQDFSRTLTESEIQSATEQMLTVLKEHGITLRG